MFHLLHLKYYIRIYSENIDNGFARFVTLDRLSRYKDNKALRKMLILIKADTQILRKYKDSKKHQILWACVIGPICPEQVDENSSIKDILKIQLRFYQR